MVPVCVHATDSCLAGWHGVLCVAPALGPWSGNERAPYKRNDVSTLLHAYLARSCNALLCYDRP